MGRARSGPGASIRTTSRLLALLVLAALAAACGTLTKADRKQLSLYLENAANYYDRGHYERAFQQWDRARSIDAENEKARLGQAYALWRLGQNLTPEGVARLTESERRFDVLVDEPLGDQGWKAQLGYGLVHEQWVDLFAERIAIDDVRRVQGDPVDEAQAAENRRQKLIHVAKAEAGFRAVLDGPQQEMVDQLTCMLSLAKLAWHRDDLEATLTHARQYETAVVRSKDLWRDGMARFPADAAIYEAKIYGAELQEAELRDLQANVLYKLGKQDEALAELDKVIALQPKRSDAYLNRGQLHEERELWDLAASDYRRFLQLTELPETDATVLDASRRMLRCQAEADRERAAAE